MKDQYVAINGKLSNFTKKEAKEVIIFRGGHFQQDINSKTTIVVEGNEPLKKKKQKIKELTKKGQEITVINEDQFLALLQDKDYKELIRKGVAVFIIILGLILMNTIPAKLFVVVAGACVLPFIADNYLNNIVFKIVVPIALFMVAFTLNFEQAMYKINGNWQTSTMALEIGDKDSKLDVIDSEGRHILEGKNKIKNGKFIIKTDYKTYEYIYDSKDDTLCYLNDKGECRFYLKRKGY